VPHFASTIRHFRRKGADAIPTRESRALVASMFAPKARLLPGENPAARSDDFAKRTSDVDVCKSLFVLAQRCQTEYLNAQGVELLFDVSGGEIPAGTCRKLELLIESMLADIAQGPAHRTGGGVTLTVRRHANAWIVGIEERGGRTARHDYDQRRRTVARGLIQDLRGTSRVEARPLNGCVVGFMFPATADELPGDFVSH